MEKQELIQQLQAYKDGEKSLVHILRDFENYKPTYTSSSVIPVEVLAQKVRLMRDAQIKNLKSHSQVRIIEAKKLQMEVDKMLDIIGAPKEIVNGKLF